MKIAKPIPSEVKNFPLDNPKAKIVAERGRFYVCEREYYWDSTAKRGREHRFYLGQIVDGVFLTTEEYKRRFKRDGSARVAEKPKNRTYRRKTKAPEAAPGNVEPKIESQQPESITIAPCALKTRRVGLTAIFTAISRQIGLWDDVRSTWGETACRVAHSFAYHWLMTNNNAAYLFKSWSNGFHLPFDHPVSAKESTEFMLSLAQTPDWEKKFFGSRIARMDEDEVFSYDATNIATKATEIVDAQFGKSKKDGYRRQIGLSVLFAHKSGLPVMFRVFPGNVADVTTVADLLSRVDILDGKRVFAAVVDRGYFSLKNLRLCIDAGQHVLFAAKLDVDWVKEAVESVMPDLWSSSTKLIGCEEWGKTIQKEVECDDGKRRPVWVHVFRSDGKTRTETLSFFADLENFEEEWKAGRYGSGAKKEALKNNRLLKYYQPPTDEPGACKLVRNHIAIDAHTRYMGMFASVSTMQCDAQAAIETYGQRDAIEKCFQAGKSDLSMDVIRSHSDDTMKGRFIISFIALCILCELHRRMKCDFAETNDDGSVKKCWKPLIGEMSYNEMQNYLDPIQLITYSADKPPVYMEVTMRQHEIAKRLGCAGAYDTVPDYATS